MAEPSLTAARSSRRAPQAIRRDRFVSDLRETADRATQAAGGQYVHLQTALGVVRLRFAGPALVTPVTRAMAHLRVAPEADDSVLTVHLWDSATTGTTMPAPPWSREDLREHGIARGFFGDRLYCQYQRGSNALTVLDVEHGIALFWVRSPEELPFSESVAPLRHLMAMWFAEYDLQFVHAAAVGDEHGAALLLGNSGAGKSSTALACLAHGIAHIGDDYCVVRLPDAEAPAAFSVYSSAKADERTLARLPFLRGMVANPDRAAHDKAVCFIHEHLPRRVSSGGPVRAMLLPRVGTGRETRVWPASAGAALAAAAPSTMLQFAGTGQATLRRLGRLARSAPCHHIELGTDSGGVAAAVARALEPAA